MAKAVDDLIVDEEFAVFLPPQSAEELSNLEQSILADGILDAVKYHKETGIVLDGHTRLKLAKKHKLDCPTEPVSIEGGREAALDWIIQYQSARRNLTDEQWSYLRGQEFLAKKKAVGRPKAKAEANGKPEDDTYSLDGQGEDDKPDGKTAEALAKKYGVSESTIERDARFATAVNELPKKERTAVLQGEADLPKKAIVAKSSAGKKAVVKKKKPGAIKFDWKRVKDEARKCASITDEIARAFDSKNSNEHRAAIKLLDEWLAKVTEWRERLEAKAKEPK